jgi:AcrR family transcriptional regulator
VPKAPGRQAARTQAARDSIVQAAFTMFALKGYTAASMDDVCLAAGCSKGGLYHHFPTKAAVLSGVVDRLARSGALVPPFRATEEATAIPEDAVGRILIEVWAEAGRSQPLRDQLRAGYEACFERALQAEARGMTGLAALLRIGALVQMLTRMEAADPEQAARRLGIERAA